MHDSFTPLGGFVPLFNIQLGEIIFGGVGAGLYGMLVFVVLAVFHRRADGRPHAGISRQENRSLRREDVDASRCSYSADRHSRLLRVGDRDEQMGHGRVEQQRSARL